MPPFNFFDWTSQELRTWLLTNGETVLVQSDQVLIKEGERCSNPILLLSGHLIVTTSNLQNRQDQVASLTAGSMVGEMSLLEQRPAVATITTSGACTVLQLSTQKLERLIKEQPLMAAHLYRVIAQKLAVQIEGQNAWTHRLHTDHAPVEALRKGLSLFATLQEQDVFTLARLGRVKRVPPETVLLNQGDEVTAVYLVLSGEAEVLFTLDGKTQLVGSSRRGELLGEMSLLLSQQQGAAAGVRSELGMDLLAIELSSLRTELRHNPALGSRFYRGLACMLSRRSRDQLLSHQRAAESQRAEQESIDWLDVNQLGAITRAARHFDWLCQHSQRGELATP
jgi:bacteriocin-type transport-associated protein